jgi:hypothetical protein
LVKTTCKTAEKGINRFFQAITSPHAYIRQITEAHDDNVQPVTVLYSIDTEPLENAVFMGCLGANVDSLENLTDAVVEEYLKGTQGCDSFLSADTPLVELK